MNQNVRFYLKLLSRRLPVMAALFLLTTCAGVLIALRLPPVYSTSATLLVEASQIPTEMVRATAQIETEEQLEVIRQRLFTRTNLIGIARENGVFPNQSAMSPDDVVSEMRSRTSLQLSTGRRSRADLMVVGFEGADPQQVADVVNAYVTVILEASTELRSGRAEGALEFFRQEVDTLSQSLDQKSAEIIEFKNQNAGALPEGLNFRLSRQSLLQERLARAERDLEALENQREEIQRIYERTGTVTGANNARTPEQARLNKLQSDLSAALGVYSDNHPRIRLLRNQIAVVEEQIQSAAALEQTNNDSEQVSALDISLAEIDSRVEALNQEATDITEELEKLQKAIDETPANGIALEAMERDLRNLQQLYSSAVQRLSEARMGERIEISAKGERIIVLEPASVPDSPSGPNRPKIMGAGIGGGLALAGGLFLLLELLNTAIRRPADITRALNITPLATIPRFETQSDRRRRRFVKVAAFVLIVIVVPVAVWSVDAYFMPLDLLLEDIVDRLN